MIWMSKMENIVMNLTGCERQIANTVINTILEEDRKANSLDESKWISVDERLPEEDVRVLVYINSERSYTKIDTDRMVDGEWVRWSKDITHWMPLPEAPKMKGGAE